MIIITTNTYTTDFCQKTFKKFTELKDHCKNSHILQCDVCRTKVTGQDQLKLHIEAFHTNCCSICKQKSGSKELLTKHLREEHPNMCHFCAIEYYNEAELKDHLLQTHTFDCKMCDFTCCGLGTMHDHILNEHAEPDSNNRYACDDCDFVSTDKDRFGIHFKTYHGAENIELIEMESSTQSELKQLQHNFERLKVMYNDSLAEADKVKAESETSLIHANDQYSRVLSENIALKEQLDTLYKLSRSYLERYEGSKSDSQSVNVPSPPSIALVEPTDKNEIEAPNTSEKSDNDWNKHKLRGFKRRSVLPTINDESRNATGLHSHSQPLGSHPQLMSSELQDQQIPAIRKQYCHFFVNTGRCSYEERTRLKCKYLHEAAPFCRDGISCARPRCMFFHSQAKSAGHNQQSRSLAQAFSSSSSFLDKSRNVRVTNPWIRGSQLNPNPWMQTASLPPQN